MAKRSTPTKKTGRPAFEPTDDQRYTVETMVAAGITQAEIANCLSIDEKTLRLHFRDELDNGLVRATAKMADSLYRQGVSGVVPAAIFWLKTRAKWREAPQEHQHTGKDGEAIEVKISDTELARKIAFTLAKAEAKETT